MAATGESDGAVRLDPELTALAEAASRQPEGDDEPLLLFVAPDTVDPRTPLRIAVPGVPAARRPMVTTIAERRPRDAKLRVHLPAGDLAAEQWLLDWWTDLPAGERARVSCVVGRMAGPLMRFAERPSVGFAFIGAAGDPRPANPQARALLAAAHPDSWTLGLDDGPQVDADRWRFRLATVVSERWGVGLVEHPVPGFELLLRELGLDHPLPSAKVMFKARPDPKRGRGAGGDQATGGARHWLDRELHARVLARFEDGAANATAPDDVWERARLASVERRLRRVERLVLPPGALAPPGGENATTAYGLSVDDPAEAAARLEPKVLRGTGGQLFLGSDSHDSYEQITGRRVLSEDELAAWERGMREREALTAAAGARLVMLIGPAPQVVLDEALPAGDPVSAQRPAVQVLERLRAATDAPGVVYPVERLREVRAWHSPFPRTDSHWNDLGAYVAYEAALDALGDEVAVRRVGRSDVNWVRTAYVGDLGSKLRPERASMFLRARLDAPTARLVHDNRVRNHGRLAIFTCEQAPASTLVVFGDSWAYALLPFLAESFRRVVFRHRVNIVDRDLIEAERPDVVLVMLTERFMTALPDDASAPSWEDVVNRKLERGMLVGPPAPGTRPTMLHSVSLERAHGGAGGLRLPPR